MEDSSPVRSVEHPSLSSQTDLTGTKKLQMGFTSIIGRRMTQEDAEVVYQDTRYDIMCVFDGHGGDECSTFCAANFKDIFF